MMHTVPILVMTLTAALAAPSLDGSPAGLTDEDYYSLDAERRVLPEVYVYDLNVNKYRPICVQAVVSKKNKKLTRVDFNPKLPVVVCGDTKGTCHVVKLSPNLRVMCKPPKKAQVADQRTLQIMKLDKLLSLVRDPPFQTGVVDEKFDDD